MSLPAAANAERLDRAINPNPEPWQWERSDDGSTDWTNVTPYHRHCEGPDSEYPLTSDDQGKHIQSYVYYNDDSSGSVVLKGGNNRLRSARSLRRAGPPGRRGRGFGLAPGGLALRE